MENGCDKIAGSRVHAEAAFFFNNQNTPAHTAALPSQRNSPRETSHSSTRYYVFRRSANFHFPHVKSRQAGRRPTQSEFPFPLLSPGRRPSFLTPGSILSSLSALSQEKGERQANLQKKSPFLRIFSSATATSVSVIPKSRPRGWCRGGWRNTVSAIQLGRLPFPPIATTSRSVTITSSRSNCAREITRITTSGRLGLLRLSAGRHNHIAGGTSRCRTHTSGRGKCRIFGRQEDALGQFHGKWRRRGRCRRGQR